MTAQCAPLNDARISIILTCYNEAKYLERAVRRIRALFAHLNHVHEIIVVDDGSSEQEFSLLTELQRRENIILLRNPENSGRGASVIKGFQSASAPIVGYIDTDLEIPEIGIAPLVIALSQGACDAAIGVRIDVSPWSMSTAFRRMLTAGYKAIVNTLLQAQGYDTTCGLKFFKRSAILPVLAEVEDMRWFFDTELIVRAIQKGLVVRQFPVILERDTSKKSSMSLAHAAIFEHLRPILRFWWSGLARRRAEPLPK
ncbi:MAG: glycosyltransferase [Elusimicrobiota bacterium]|jgi:glycosyltransferase involved in cell wall biosynthesis